MDTEPIRLCVRLDIRRIDFLAGDDTDAPVRTHDVFDKEGAPLHHRPPPGLIPAAGSVVERQLELAVVVNSGIQLFREPGADGMNANREIAGFRSDTTYGVNSVSSRGWRV